MNEAACIGVTFFFFRWQVLWDWEDRHFYCQFGPLAIDLYIGDES